MSQKPPRHQRLFAELKRRKVFRVMAVYGAVAFGVLQIAEPVAEALRLPDSFLPMVVVLLLLGFPMAVVLAWAFELTPDGVQRSDAAQPEEIEAIVAQPAARRWTSGLLALGGVAVLVAGAWFAGRQSAAPAAEAAGPVDTSIAVLPFADMSPTGDQEYFADGISEELLNLLAGVPELRVAARTSSFAFKGDEVAIDSIARALNVAHVLEGSVRKADERIRVTAQLIRAADGYHVWSQTWDRTLDDIFAIQDAIAADVVDQLRVTLLDTPPMVEETDPEAYALVLQARHLSEQRTPASLARAEELLRNALEIDPDYAGAWAGLAQNYYRMGLGQAWDSVGGLARDAAERALELDPELARIHALLGRIVQVDGELATAAGHYQTALAMDPQDPEIVGDAALALIGLDRVEDAIPLLQYEQKQDPVSLAAHVNLGLAYMSTGRHEEAVEVLRTALDLSPAAGGIRFLLGEALVFAGRPDAALEVLEDEPLEAARLNGLAIAYHALGRAEESEAALATTIEKYERQMAFNIAYAAAYRGEADRAFEWLDRAVRYDDPGLSEIFLMPHFDTLKDDPRWDVFLDRIDRSREELADVEFEVRLPR